jgi:MFS family permease
MGIGTFLDRNRTIAAPGYNRWLAPPAALAIHLCVGQAYAFSVFNIPLTRLIGIKTSAPDDWKPTTISLIFSFAIVFLGLSAAVFGKWLEAAGPRKAMFAAALCFGGGFQVAALGIRLHQFWLVFLGYSVIGGIGLGIGYISPVSTLIKWFPDRPGMATGLAIMGFGGGALIGSPLAVDLMKRYATSNTILNTPSNTSGVMETFVTMGLIYLAFMMFGVCTVRVPAPDWSPIGPLPAILPKRLVTSSNLAADRAIRTPQFWLLWLVLFCNVTAGIGVLSQASPMIQTMFARTVTASAASGFVGLLSLFNLAGRFVWSSLSDVIGRKTTYTIYFLLGIALYALAPAAGHLGSVALFVACFAVILSMYGGGFATIPAYLRDLFGSVQVGAIHGRLLTAWSAAGIVGPLLISYLSEYQRSHGVKGADAYATTLYLLAALLGVGLICNALVKPVASKHFAADTHAVVSDGDPSLPEASIMDAQRPDNRAASGGFTVRLLLHWLVIGLPLAWGILETFKKALTLFR